jgi:hypothetical protein
MNYIMSPKMLKFTKEFENCEHKHPSITILMNGMNMLMVMYLNTSE